MQPQSLDINNSKRKMHPSLKIDMTPMVDLGFLLISFFIFTTSISEKRSMNLFMPKDGPPEYLKEAHALTAVLAKNDKVYVYEGMLEEASVNKKIIATDYNTYKGLGELIREKQKKLSLLKAKDQLMLLIKPLDQSSYKNLVDALDEVMINNVKKYAIVQPSKVEQDYSYK
jgi:biopolymer transport protein ExbD